MLILGGELVVTVGDATGCGGRNQEFVLAAAGRIAGSAHIAIASVDSEGTDGPTEAAGGIVDGETLARAQAAGLDIGAELANHNSSAVLGGLDDLIVTGVRGTNVRDLRLIYVRLEATGSGRGDGASVIEGWGSSLSAEPLQDSAERVDSPGRSPAPADAISSAWSPWLFTSYPDERQAQVAHLDQKPVERRLVGHLARDQRFVEFAIRGKQQAVKPCRP